MFDIEQSQKIKRIFLFLAIVFLIFGSYSVGLLVGKAELRFEKGYIPRIIHKEKDEKIEDIDFGLFWKVWDLVDQKFAGRPDHQKMLYGAISGMLKSLGDPYTVYLTPEQAKSFLEEMSGGFEGIGAEIGKKDDNLVIVSVLENTPAQRAGLKSGDIILKINGEETQDLNVDEAVLKIRGPKGTEVRLEIKRERQYAIEFKIIRDTIKVENIRFEEKEGFAYIKINEFSENIISDFNNIKSKILGFKGIILDLRNNPGGYLDGAVDIASEFIEKDKIIVYEKLKNGKKESYKSSGSNLLNQPLVVLVNKGSASASEIVAGAVQDHNRGILIGEKTFGKGSVQSLEELPLGILKITIAHWLTPNGRSISEDGLLPNIEIKMDKNNYLNSNDLQLKKAIEYLKEKTQ